MTQQQQPPKLDWKKIVKSAGPYPVEAFSFVREGLSFTVHRVHAEGANLPEGARHITGQQLCLGLRDFAIEQFGFLAQVVLMHWNIIRTDDFGRIVYAMIEAGLMSRTQEDSLDDFRGVFDFSEAFARDEILRGIGAN